MLHLPKQSKATCDLSIPHIEKRYTLVAGVRQQHPRDLKDSASAFVDRAGLVLGHSRVMTTHQGKWKTGNESRDFRAILSSQRSLAVASEREILCHVTLVGSCCPVACKLG